jgi:hypothetical protein
MGNSYYRNLSGWNNGPTPSGCTADQDNLSIITTRNGFTYRKDDFSDDPSKNPALLNAVPTFSADGIITTNTDKDAFKINLPKNGILHIDAAPYSVGANNEGADLDIKVTLLNEKMKVVKVYDPLEQLNVTVDTTLMAGDYYIVLNGAGNANATNYGSLGSYRISGVFSPMFTMPVSQVLLSGESVNGKHDLNWSITSGEAIQSIVVESSLDGSIFSTLTKQAVVDKNFEYTPIIDKDVYYRLKVTLLNGETSYSNTVLLKAVQHTGKLFSISSLVNSEIKVNASQNYQYQLADMSGRIIKTGRADAGVSTININNSPNGIYIMQIICNSQRTTQRIVKL